MTAPCSPRDRVTAALAASLRGDAEGARLLVDLIPASQLRVAVLGLVEGYAAALLARAPGHGEEFADAVAEVLEGWAAS